MRRKENHGGNVEYKQAIQVVSHKSPSEAAEQQFGLMFAFPKRRDRTMRETRWRTKGRKRIRFAVMAQFEFLCELCEVLSVLCGKAPVVALVSCWQNQKP